MNVGYERGYSVIPLPSSCEGCPFYRYKDHPSNSYTPDKIVKGSKVFFLAQNPGKDEAEGRWLIRRTYSGAGQYTSEYKEVTPQPLIGATGQQFNTRFLPLSGLTRDEVSLGNAIRCRPGVALNMKPDDLPSITATMKLEHSKADIVNALKHCKQTHLHIPESVNVVVTMGRHAMFTMTGLSKDEDEYKKKQSVLESWRGYGVDVDDYSVIRTVDTGGYHNLVDRKVVFFTMHIAALNYGLNKRFYHATLQDFYKLGRLLRGEWPQPLPQQWSTSPPDNWPDYASFDTEYNPYTTELYRWSMCDVSNNLYAIESGNIGESVFQDHKQTYTVLIQNALADIGYLNRLVDIRRVRLEDMMLAYSVLWPGEPYSLNYINSVYGTLNRYKHLSSNAPQLYSALDAWEPMQMWRSYFIPEFKRDRQSWRVYRDQRIPLIHIIDKAQRSGVKVDTTRLQDVKSILEERLLEYENRARLITGDDNFKLGGRKQMAEVMYA